MINKTILIVEDDNIIAFELKFRLEDKGYYVVGPYAYGEQAIEGLNSFEIDLILMDINIRGNIDGIQTAEIIKSKKNIPVIYLTAYTDPKTLERAKITDPYGYIIKPFEDRDLFTSIDIALYKHSLEMKLIESEKWLHTTLKSIGDGVIATDINANIIFMNQVAENLTGWSVEDSIGKKLSEVFNIISEITREPAFNPVERVLHEGIILSLANHTLLINKNGEEISIADSASPIKDDFGNISGCVLVFQDHTEKKIAEKKLYESEKKFRLIAENSSDGIITFDSEANIKYVSPSFLNQLGYANEEEFEKNAMIFAQNIHHEDRNELIQKITEAVSSRIDNLVYSYRIRNLAGEFIWREDNATFEYHTNGNFIGAYIISRDITKQKLIEDQLVLKNKELVELNASKDKFFSIIAHDLLGPFNGFLGTTKIISEGIYEFQHDELKELSSTMYKSANNLYNLLDNLLVWSRSQINKIELIPDDCNLAYIVNNVIDVNNEIYKKKRIQIINKLPDNVFVYSDIPTLNSVLRNIIANAIKFTHLNGEIEIDLLNCNSIGDDYICFFVKDNGIGMTQELQDNLFKIDYNVSRPGTDGEPSTGLGLLLCKEFVEKNGGKIWVESEEGRGSTFYVKLKKGRQLIAK